ncbi:MAG: hypothetical protein ACW98D_11795 [Promethearchaeota archaeon]|jgi:hypothetical protein
MLNSKDDNSEKDYSGNLQEVNAMKTMRLEESKELKKSFSRLRKVFLRDPVSHELDSKHNRELQWFLYHPYSVEDYNHIFYYLTSFGFHLVLEKKKYYHFSYKFPKDVYLYVEVHKISEGFSIRAYIECGINKERICNTLTSSILSELASYLQKVDSESQSITRTVEKTLRLNMRKDVQFNTPVISNSVANLNGEIKRARPVEQNFILKKSKIPKRRKVVQRFMNKGKTKIPRSKIYEDKKKGKKFKNTQDTDLIIEKSEFRITTNEPEVDHEEIYVIIEDGRRQEEERINKEIIPFINAFLKIEFEKIYQEAIQNNDYTLSRENLKHRVRINYEYEANRVSSLYAEDYTMKFDKYLKKDFDGDFDNLVGRLQLLSGTPKQRFPCRFKEWVISSKGDIIILFITLGLILVVYSLLQWIFGMPLFERFDFFNTHQWIIFPISILIITIIILTVLFISNVRAYIREERINHG